MDDDDDAPPMLVTADGAPVEDEVAGRLSADMDDVKITKVPITIITGMPDRLPLLFLFVEHDGANHSVSCHRIVSSRIISRPASIPVNVLAVISRTRSEKHRNKSLLAYSRRDI